jgi:hypothetical protein
MKSQRRPRHRQHRPGGLRATSGRPGERRGHSSRRAGRIGDPGRH